MPPYFLTISIITNWLDIKTTNWMFLYPTNFTILNMEGGDINDCK